MLNRPQARNPWLGYPRTNLKRLPDPDRHTVSHSRVALSTLEEVHRNELLLLFSTRYSDILIMHSCDPCCVMHYQDHAVLCDVLRYEMQIRGA